MTKLTAEQSGVETAIDRFVRNRQRQQRAWFTFTGPAGCGKSLLLGHLAQKHPQARLCTFTGKAASVLSRKSGRLAETIHSAIYACYGRDKETEELKFGRKVEDGDWSDRIIIIDEAGTCNEWLAKDLLATGCRIIAAGDENQLSPVKGRPFFLEQGVDAQLAEVHRQAWDSAIIRQAHSVRNGDGYRDDGPDFRVMREVPYEDLMQADVVLCWKNATRIELNRMIRRYRGRPWDRGVKGEMVMALKNSAEFGTLNGAVYELLEDHRSGSGIVAIRNERGEEVEVGKAWIEDMENVWHEEDSNGFAWSESCTVHKYQGSSSPNVIVVDEYDRSYDRDRWLYTALTRAEKQVIVQRWW